MTSICCAEFQTDKRNAVIVRHDTIGYYRHNISVIRSDVIDMQESDSIRSNC